MEWLNYHHLHYFWTVAREGSIARAAQVLNLSQPTISTQIKTLEASLGTELLERQGRGLTLTPTGEMAFAYAEDIFSLGRELLGAVGLGMTDRPMRLRVGLVDAVPKTLASELLRPALDLERKVHLVVEEGKMQDLVEELAVHRLDMVLSDDRVKGTSAPRIFHHEMVDCGISILAGGALARKLRKGFPASLNGAPAILPTENTALRNSLQGWFDEQEILPLVFAEIEDGALIKDLAGGGNGFIAVPDLVAPIVCRRHGLRVVGTAEECREKVWALSLQQRLTHPGVQAIINVCRTRTEW
jgi:LysR family transcriptional activator of nhaA